MRTADVAFMQKIVMEKIMAVQLILVAKNEKEETTNH